jgi:glutaredoxin
MPTITLYTKAGCHLCERAQRTILSLQRELGFQFEQRDITQDAAIWERYRFDIPVIAIDGQERFRHRVSETELRAALKRSSA